MNSPLEQVNELDNLIRQLQKMESKMRVGQWIDSWREVNRVIAYLVRKKESVMKGMAKISKEEQLDEE